MYKKEHLSLPLPDPSTRSQKRQTKVTQRTLSLYLYGVQLYAGVIATFVYVLLCVLLGKFALLLLNLEILAAAMFPLVIVSIWCVAPRFYGYPPAIVLAESDEFPILNETVRQLAALIGVAPPALFIAECHDAGFARLGLRQRGVIKIGHSLISILTMREALNLLAHEIAHAADRAFTRSLYVRIAYGMLDRWSKLFDPATLTGWKRIFFPIAFLLWAMTRPFYLQLRACISIDHQAAERWVDGVAVQIVGGGDVTELFYKLTLKHNADFMDAYRDASLDQKYEVVRRAALDLPASVHQRVVQCMLAQSATRFARHPCIFERINFQRTDKNQPARITINRRRFAALHGELKAWPRIMARREAAYYAQTN